MAAKDFWVWEEDFFGQGSFTVTQADNAPLRITQTGTAGTYVYVDGSSSGELAVDLEATSEIQNICVSMGDILQWDIDKITDVYFKLKMNEATMDTTAQFAFGVTGDRNDDIDTVAQAALFRIIGNQTLVTETDDGTNNNDDIATGKTLANVYKEFLISFAAGTNDVRFFVDGEPVSTATTFDMSNYAASLQPFLQIQKTADTNTDGFTVDLIRARGIR